jgi:hypothetical protein
VSIVNKRNALLGWVVWKAGKGAAKRKAKQAVQRNEKSRGGKRVIVPTLAAVGGAAWFWRRRRSENEG